MNELAIAEAEVNRLQAICARDRAWIEHLDARPSTLSVTVTTQNAERRAAASRKWLADEQVLTAAKMRLRDAQRGMKSS